ncbi:isochorismatase family protein [Nocardioides sp. LMS-CY]|uniref:Nicotinamidase-related amidase n=1 Tax=Nocardioides soli TaxID=1036020 RepID=A0A7W4VVL8_9ACTN|nr:MULTISPECIES: isochorismatase family protein [Nocardioides]MBB3042596.1 nicotinamidase-related amidase [Nocardioides soli]QWF22720.1 isochorismatase family protein [Nocardioides sp. LMS-CY]
MSTAPTNESTDDTRAADTRIWDRFLTPQDQEVARRQSKTQHGIGPRPAVVVIDVYRRVFGERPLPLLEAIVETPSSCGLNAWEALGPIQDLLREARRLGLPVIHVTGDPQIPGWRNPRGGATSRADAEAGYRIMDEVAPLPDEVVIRKSAPSAFFGTPLVALLRQWDVDSLIVAGESTSGCVRATVVDARSHRFAVTVVEECVFDRTESTHAINLFDMDQKYADVRPLADVLTTLGSRAQA